MRVFSSRALGALCGGAIAALSVLSVNPALSSAPDVPSAVSSKLVKGSDLSRLWTVPGSRKRVIVQFAQPTLSLPVGIDNPAQADAAQIAAVHAAQDAIIGAAFGSGATAGPQADVLAIKRMNFSPMFAVSVTADQLASLAASPQVLQIQEDALAKPYLDEAVPLVGMTNAYAAGATGAGYAVAVLDSGTRRTHEFITGKVVSAACYGTTDVGNQSVPYCPGGAESSVAIDSANDCDPATVEGCGHGTHVSGISAGFNTNRQAGEPANGVARSGALITVNVFSTFTNFGSCTGPCILSYTSDQILGLERVFALRNTFKIAAVNMSLGGSQEFAACDTDARKPIIDQLRAAGIATVIAAGNSGFDSSVGVPACISSAVTVASSTKADVRSSFSNWGTLIDVVAPGSQIFASFPNGASNTSYAVLSGTSMAAPMVAGTFAAIRTARPSATVDQIENALKSTGLGITAANVTKPRIRVDLALAQIPAPNAAIVSAVTPVARATSINGTVTAFATILNTSGITATSCSVALPAGFPTVAFSYSSRNITTGAPENPNVPINIAAGAGRNFVLSFRPTAAISANIPLVFDCTNSSPAPSVSGLNTFLLTGTAVAPADLVSIAVTATNDGIMNVPLGATGFASLAAVNIGATAGLQARLTVNPIGVSNRTLPATLTMCQTNPGTGACISAQAATLNFTSTAGGTVTFSAFVTSNGTPIAFDPANKRVFVHFFQGTSPVGSASVAVRTIAPSPNLALAN